MFQLTILLPIKLLIKLSISYFLALVSLEDEFNRGVIAHTFAQTAFANLENS